MKCLCALLLLGRGRSRRTVRGRTQTLCGGLGYLCGSELKIGATWVTWDLDGLALGAVVVLPAALDKLAGPMRGG
jgi:hypothetical protein